MRRFRFEQITFIFNQARNISIHNSESSATYLPQTNNTHGVIIGYFLFLTRRKIFELWPYSGDGAMHVRRSFFISRCKSSCALVLQINDAPCPIFVLLIRNWTKLTLPALGGNLRSEYCRAPSAGCKLLTRTVSCLLSPLSLPFLKIL